MFYLALALLLIQVFELIVLLEGRWKARTLPKEAVDPPPRWPRVSIIVPARDEAREIEAALQSVLHLDYPDFEVVVIEDRSTDGTADVLRQVQSKFPQLRVETVTELPDGWLGKNHALHRGSQLATGELLLFTDADIVFAPNTLRRAVALLLREKLDHLALAPTVRSRSLFVNLVVCNFVRQFSLFLKPWQARNPKSPRHVGIGAFNLVRRSAFDQVGGMTSIPLRPDDDVKLGKILKHAGFAQDIYFAEDALSLEWYDSFGAMTRGLEKNVLAGVDYRAWLVFVGMGVLLAKDVGPWFLLPFTEGLGRWFAAGSGFIAMFAVAMFLRQVQRSPLYAIFTPILTVAIAYMFVRSVLLTYWRGGIRWRDTFYPLAVLRKNQV